MKISSTGILLIERFEGLKLRAYRDGNGIWTIGYGHTGAGQVSAVTCGEFETQAQAEADLCGDIAGAEAAVTRLVRVPLTQGQFDALVSFTYNEGQGRLRDSTLLKLLNAGCYKLAAGAFGSWDIVAGEVSEGLEARRQAEVSLFNS